MNTHNFKKCNSDNRNDFKVCKNANSNLINANKNITQLNSSTNNPIVNNLKNFNTNIKTSKTT